MEAVLFNAVSWDMWEPTKVKPPLNLKNTLLCALGGGFKHDTFYVYRFLGRWSNFEYYFSDGLGTTN